MSQSKPWQGYIVVDLQERLLYHTLRSSRAASWQALFNRRLSRSERRMWQRRGYLCVKVQLTETF
ncbi:MAG TPA: hypothetical protein VNP04_03940 [Alphaproteobacteria bacterium]|nr:hypothetical protein [Alphaproteobacteria bacterium]